MRGHAGGYCPWLLASRLQTYPAPLQLTSEFATGIGETTLAAAFLADMSAEARGGEMCHPGERRVEKDMTRTVFTPEIERFEVVPVFVGRGERGVGFVEGSVRGERLREGILEGLGRLELPVPMLGEVHPAVERFYVSGELVGIGGRVEGLGAIAEDVGEGEMEGVAEERVGALMVGSEGEGGVEVEGEGRIGYQVLRGRVWRSLEDLRGGN